MDGCWGGGFGGGGGNGGGDNTGGGNGSRGNGGDGNGGSPTGGTFCRCLPALTSPHLHPFALKCRLMSWLSNSTRFPRLFLRKCFRLKQSNPRLRTVVWSVTR